MFDGISSDYQRGTSAEGPRRRENWLARIVAWYRKCCARARQRRDLARLDDRLLADIGLTRADQSWECSKVFWR